MPSLRNGGLAVNYFGVGTLFAFLCQGGITGWADWHIIPSFTHQALDVGAINHWALNTPDIEAAWANAHELGLKVKEDEIQSIPTFWDNGIRYFNIYGPNGETLEFCQIV
ncbi:VOC family protein [Bifidobacterium vespertilionis]|uniref:VOC family protein n=1 Tax=Bifidobacterium vespertilionis TaxID=2562524 RepID=UPI001F0A9DAF|nr:VOC family protein [Bifidobacterium vespertilionis]